MSFTPDPNYRSRQSDVENPGWGLDVLLSDVKWFYGSTERKCKAASSRPTHPFPRSLDLREEVVRTQIGPKVVADPTGVVCPRRLRSQDTTIVFSCKT